MNTFPRLKSVIEIEIKVPKKVKVKDFGTGSSAGFLEPCKVEALQVFKESGEVWILIDHSDGLRGLSRNSWLHCWHMDWIEMRIKQGEEWRGYFNDEDLK